MSHQWQWVSNCWDSWRMPWSWGPLCRWCCQLWEHLEMWWQCGATKISDQIPRQLMYRSSQEKLVFKWKLETLSKELKLIILLDKLLLNIENSNSSFSETQMSSHFMLTSYITFPWRYLTPIQFQHLPFYLVWEKLYNQVLGCHHLQGPLLCCCHLQNLLRKLLVLFGPIHCPAKNQSWFW